MTKRQKENVNELSSKKAKGRPKKTTALEVEKISLPKAI